MRLHVQRLATPLILATLLGACGAGPQTAVSAPTASAAPIAPSPPPPVAAPSYPALAAMPAPPPAARPAILVERPYIVQVPSRTSAAAPSPVIVELHGYSGDGLQNESFFGLAPVAAAHGAILVLVDGTKDSQGHRFWNATDACCDLEGRKPDDVAYLDAVLDDVAERFSVDVRRVWIVGHSNGGFMAHRYACERAARVAGFVSLAGAGWLAPSRCMPTEPVAALQVSGDADAIIHAGGGNPAERSTVKALESFGVKLPPGAHPADYPDVHGSLAPWVQRNGCDAQTEAGAPLDLDTKIKGAETTVERWRSCKDATELWTVHKGSHTPNLGPSWAEAIYAFLDAHPKRLGLREDLAP